MSHEADVETVVRAVKESRKYQDTHEETIRSLAAEAVRQHRTTKLAVKAVRKRLHGIMAPYLGDPDYPLALKRLENAYGSAEDASIKHVCLEILQSHLSTRERIPILSQFYTKVFEVTGVPDSLLDIACGLNPLSLPWMGLPQSVRYHAYDIHEPRILFLNQYFALAGLPRLARLQDVALNPPQETADVALFLKEMPRFDRNYRGAGRQLLESIRARHLVISFPSVSTHGGRNLVKRYRDFFYQLIQGKSWPVTELLFEGELLFCAERNDL
jgi:16S rRNA (guanine(1405)-N(7))-methyltransferase